MLTKKYKDISELFSIEKSVVNGIVRKKYLRLNDQLGCYLDSLIKELISKSYLNFCDSFFNNKYENFSFYSKYKQNLKENNKVKVLNKEFILLKRYYSEYYMIPLFESEYNLILVKIEDLHKVYTGDQKYIIELIKIELTEDMNFENLVPRSKKDFEINPNKIKISGKINEEKEIESFLFFGNYLFISYKKNGFFHDLIGSIYDKFIFTFFDMEKINVFLNYLKNNYCEKNFLRREFNTLDYIKTKKILKNDPLIKYPYLSEKEKNIIALKYF